MPNPRYPAAHWNPGAHANYEAGQTDVRAVVCHYTVGYDSTAIGLQGTFNFLVSRDGRIQQFSPVDAKDWHCGEANWVGPGIEIEHYPTTEPDVFTDAARDATSGLIHWLHDEWHVELAYYDGPRIPPDQMHAFVAHKSIQQSEGHSDSWPREDWDRMVAGAGPPKRKRAPMATVFQSELSAIYVEGMTAFVATPDIIASAVAQGVPLIYVTHAELTQNFDRVLNIDQE